MDGGYKRTELNPRSLFNPRAMLLADARRRFSGVLEITDILGGNSEWYKGRFTVDRDAVAEICFENTGMMLPGTNVSYLGVWRHRRCIIEIQLNSVCASCDETTFGTLIAPLMQRLHAYSPMRVAI